MKEKTNTTEQLNLPFVAEPPALAGGVNAAANAPEDNVAAVKTDVLPPADAGGSALEGGAITQLQAENEQLKASIRLNEAHRQITGELMKAGARSPGLLFDSIKADLQFADDGSVANGAALVERLKSGFPEQFGFERSAGSIDGGAGVAGAPRLTKETLAKMKTAEIAALDWADVRRVLAAN